MTDDTHGDDSETAVLVNGERLRLDSPSLAQLLSARGIVDARGVAVAINGAMLPHEQWLDRQLEDGDRVEIVKAMVGG